MKNQLLTADVWRGLSSTTKKARNPIYVAVAYFGQGASKRLPLPPNSRLVVDASDGAVKSGQTCPAELKRLQKRGVVIYSAPNLHAKVYVFDKSAIIGSANVSDRSAGTLIEAMVHTSDRGVVRSARAFVRSLCLHELSPGALDRLHRIYRPPHVPGGGPRSGRSVKQRMRPTLPRLFLAQLEMKMPPDGSEATEEKGLRVAKTRQKHRRRYVIDDFWWSGNCPFRAGDKVVQVVEEDGGRRFITAPADVVYECVWRKNGRRVTFVYFEHPDVRRIRLEKLARRLGYGAKKQLSRNGIVRDQDFAEKLLASWNSL